MFRINSQRDMALVVMGMVEGRGGTFTLHANGKFTCDLNPCGFTTEDEAENVASSILTLSDQIRRVLHERVSARPQ